VAEKGFDAGSADYCVSGILADNQGSVGWGADEVASGSATVRRGGVWVAAGGSGPHCGEERGARERQNRAVGGFALCHLLGPESELRGEVFSAAIDRQQAGIMFSEMEAIIMAVPEFAARLQHSAVAQVDRDCRRAGRARARFMRR
jgi:hypothetical protein